MKCTNCGAAIASASTFCGYCGSAMSKSSGPAAPAVAVESRLPAMAPLAPMPAMGGAMAMPQMAGMHGTPVQDSFSDVKPIYQEEFARIEAAGGRASASRWNWTAFWFSCIWYLIKGMWVKSLLLFALSVCTGGAAGIFIAIYMGKYGNYDYYLSRVKNKQLW